MQNNTVAITTDTQKAAYINTDTIPAPPEMTYELGGKLYPVKELCKLGKVWIPMPDIKMMSDYQWQAGALQSRLEHPELYRDSEDVDTVIAKLRKWLDEHEPEE